MKKKAKIFSTALAATMCATSLLGLVACSKGAGEVTGDIGDNTGDTGVYTITLNTNGGTLASGVATSYTTVGGKITAALPTSAQITRENYTFAGWYTAATGGSVVNTTYTFTADGSIFAHWNPAQTTPGGNDQTTPGGDDQTTPGGDDQTTPGGDDQTTPGGDDQTTPSGEFTITFDANGGTLVGNATVATVGGKITNPPSATNGDKQFIGWGEEAEMSSPIDFDTKTFTSNCTLYAQYLDSDISGDVGEISFTYNYSAAFVFASGETIVISFNSALPSWADATAPFVHMWTDSVGSVFGDGATASLNKTTYNVDCSLSEVTFMIAFTQEGAWKKTENQSGASFTDGNEYVFAAIDFNSGWVMGEDGVFTSTMTTTPITRQ